MNIEEKARAYDEALKKARILVGYPTTQPFISDLQDLFPELAESGDERIRKALIHFFSNTENTSFEYWEGIPKSKVIAWLEKQGGLKYTQRDIDDAYLKGIADVKREVKKIDEQTEKMKKEIAEFIFNSKEDIKQRYEWIKCLGFDVKFSNEDKQSEQKPADNKGMNIDEESMTPFQKKVFCIIDTAIEEEQGLKQVCDELLRLAHDEIIQKFAWSEEDEKILSDIIKDLVHPWNEYIPDRIEDEIKWLKNKLKSLRPQSTWKPTEQQMKVLNEVINFAADHGTMRWNDYIYNVLKGLREQLKKL